MLKTLDQKLKKKWDLSLFSRDSSSGAVVQQDEKKWGGWGENKIR